VTLAPGIVSDGATQTNILQPPGRLYQVRSDDSHRSVDFRHRLITLRYFAASWQVLAYLG
jgi:hypothetical protein